MAALSRVEQLPLDVVHHIMSHLTVPRSRLPGLTERQSEHDYSQTEKKAARETYHTNPVAPPDDNEPYIMRVFRTYDYPHPFNALAATSRRWRYNVEWFCAHLVKQCNRFHLPIAQIQQHGSHTVYPDMSGIVYRRLWLQYAPRYCLFCKIPLAQYPFRGHQPVVSCCNDCFMSQIYVSTTWPYLQESALIR